MVIFLRFDRVPPSQTLCRLHEPRMALMRYERRKIIAVNLRSVMFLPCCGLNVNCERACFRCNLGCDE